MKGCLGLLLLIPTFLVMAFCGMLILRLFSMIWPRARRRSADFRDLAQRLGGKFGMSLPGEPWVEKELEEGTFRIKVVFQRYRTHTEIEICEFELGQDRWKDVQVEAKAEGEFDGKGMGEEGVQAAREVAAALGGEATIVVGRTLSGEGLASVRANLWINEREDFYEAMGTLARGLVLVGKSLPVPETEEE